MQILIILNFIRFFTLTPDTRNLTPVLLKEKIDKLNLYFKNCLSYTTIAFDQGGKPMKGMGNMMKQAQKLQSQMLKLQEEMAEKTVETTAGGGMVKVVANGKQQIVSIQIEQEVVDPEDVDMLQDLILAAVNEALTKSQEMVGAEMSKLTGGLNIPGIM
jgi:DNA-binding YbaB/EbfC family protein